MTHAAIVIRPKVDTYLTDAPLQRSEVQKHSAASPSSLQSSVLTIGAQSLTTSAKYK
jgi:hypothetical protein